MNWNDKLVSVLILNYNSTDSLPRALSSVYAQDYPRIEIIVSDDGTEGFSAEDVYQDAMEHKSPNIERVEVVMSNKNTGTVRNLRRAIEHMRGDYYINFGSDDMLYNDRVISTYISTFFMYNWKPLLVCGQLGMYDSSLARFQRMLLTPEDKEILLARDPNLLFNALASRCVVPTVATCYSKDFPQTVDAYDTVYKYYEDYPTFLRMARKGITPVYVDAVMTKHAAGGIANCSKQDPRVARQFYNDRQRMWETELLPYRDKLTEESLAKNKARRKMEKDVYLSSSGRVSISSLIHKATKKVASSTPMKRLMSTHHNNMLHLTMLKIAFMFCETSVLLGLAKLPPFICSALWSLCLVCLALALPLLLKKILNISDKPLSAKKS